MAAYDVMVLGTGAAGLTAAATPAELRSRVLDLAGNVIRGSCAAGDAMASPLGLTYRGE